jgi:DNA polymerase III sliding clamp (beta) subunit (PCNA family)
MKFSLSAQDLKRALNTCNEIAPATSVIADEKTGVLIRASGESVVFMSTDENLAVRVEVPALVKEAGEALVKCGPCAGAGATFVDASDDGKLNDVQVETTTKDTLKFTGNSKFARHYKNFPLLNVGFFIETPAFEEEQSTLFPAFQFMDGLSKVSHAASNDTAKPQFNCIALTLSDNEVVFAATDGVQIAEYKTRPKKAAEVKGLRGSFILGLKFANLAAKLINPNLVDVQIYQQEDTFHLKSGGTVLVGALINTAFPEYAPHLETEKLMKASFSTEAFRATVQDMQPTVDVKSHRLVIEAKASAGTANVSTSSVIGDAGLEDEWTLDVETPLDFVFHVDSVLLQNATRQLKGDVFDLYFADSTNARGLVLKSEKDEDFRAFVCTLKIIE